MLSWEYAPLKALGLSSGLLCIVFWCQFGNWNGRKGASVPVFRKGSSRGGHAKLRGNVSEIAFSINVLSFQVNWNTLLPLD